MALTAVKAPAGPLPSVTGGEESAAAAGKPRVKWRFTKSGRLFHAICILLYLASLTSQSGFLLFIIGVFVGCYAINLFEARRMVRQVEVHPPASVHLAEGQRLSQPWRVRNQGDRPAGMMRVDAGQGALLRVGTLAAGAEVSVAPEQVYWKRGVYSHGEASLVSAYPFGFIEATRPLQLPGEVVVYPAVYETHSPRAAGFDSMVGGKYRGNRRSASGSNFAGLRPFQSGDPLKQIHWKSSSKGLGLMVKTFEEELSGRVAVIMDGGHTGDAKIFDDCVRAAGSLMFAALDAGHHVEWIELRRLEAQLYPPFTDGHPILDALARVEMEPGCLQAERLTRAVERVSPRSALVFVLTELAPEVRAVIDPLLARGRVVSIYLPESAVIPPDFTGLPVWTYTEHAMVERA